MLTDWPQAKVLIIGRDKRITGILEYILNKRNYLFETAGNEREAVLITENFKFDVALLDLTGFRCDSHDMLRKIKKYLKNKKIPLLILTALPIRKVKKGNTGIGNYIRKPFFIGRFYKRIAETIANNRRHYS